MGKYKSVIPVIVTFDHEGQKFEGKLVSIQPIISKKYDSECNLYVLENAGERISCILGNATDEKLIGIDLIGKNIMIIYNGKLELENGRKMNSFDILVEDTTANGK